MKATLTPPRLLLNWAAWPKLSEVSSLSSRSAAGRGPGERGLFLTDLKAPPLPNPLLHFAEEREKGPSDLSLVALNQSQCPPAHSPPCLAEALANAGSDGSDGERGRVSGRLGCLDRVLFTVRAVLAICGLAAGWDASFYGSVRAAEADDPAVEMASLHLADGFQINLFASERDGILKPIQIRFDARGRLWVIGSTVYPQIEPGQIPDDKVLLLEDRDGDGRADKTTVFADGLMIPTGIELGDGGVYLGHGTELLFLKDTNGDGRADERRVVLRGFGTGDNHQNINSFLFGPGGELWMSQGLHIRSHVETPWGVAQLEQAGIWRFRPGRARLEGFYGSEYEPQNPWGFVFTDWGEPIVLAGNNSSPIYPVPGLVVNHLPAPPPLIWRRGQGRKVSGGDIVGTAHFPSQWQGALLVGGYINNAVWALRIVDDGAGFALEDLPPLITSTNRAFRPVDVKFGPDGALYICDWYNPIIGHYQASFRDPGRDKTHGRIWRVTATGRPLTRPPDLTTASTPALLAQLESPDRWTRQFAKRALADRPAETVTIELRRWISTAGRSEHALKEALGVIQSHEVVEPDLLARLTHAADAGARAYAAGAIGSWADRLADPLSLLRPLVSDPIARVRLQAIVACSYIPTAKAMDVAAQAADFPLDKFLEYGFRQTVFALKPYWLPALKAGNLALAARPAQLGALIAADRTPDTLEALRALLRSGQIAPATREVFLALLAENGNGEDLAAIFQLTDEPLQARLLPRVSAVARSRGLRPAGDVEAMFRPLVRNPNPEIESAALELAGFYQLEGFRPDLESAAQNQGKGVKVRRAAVKGLAALKGYDQKLFLRLATESVDDLLKSGAIAAIAAHDLPAAASLAAGQLDHLEDPASLNELFSAFLQRQDGPDALVTAFALHPPPRGAAAAALQLLNSSGRRHPSLARLLANAAGFQLSSQDAAGSQMAALVVEVQRAGNPTEGAKIFRRPELACASCHSVQGEGGNIGPDLSTLGTAQPIEFIIGAILEPQKEVKEGYTSVLLITTDGEEYEGYQVRETPEEVVLRDILQRKEVHVARARIQAKREHGSVMPSGLADSLTRAEFRDLVRFLSELGKPR